MYPLYFEEEIREFLERDSLNLCIEMCIIGMRYN